MKKNRFLFAAVLCVALVFGFSSCENPDDNEELLNRIEQLENELNDLKNDKDKTDSADKDGDKDTSSDSPVSNFTSAAFSVSADKQVYFFSGNLQYIQSSDTWQFASYQWECVGADNVTGGVETFDERFGYRKEGAALADKIDLFGWSTGATNFGVSTSEDYDDYSGSFVDWGRNQIGSDAPNTWRTLTNAEWEYLLETRTNASSLKGVAEVNGVNGLILLPDSWTCPDGITFKSGFYDGDYRIKYYAVHQTFTANQWSKMEAVGAVFLPASGQHFGSLVDAVQYVGCYWSSTSDDSDSAWYLFFGSSGFELDFGGRCYGRSVRLVKDL